MNVYDFDKTIYKNDSTADFFLFCLRRHPAIIKILPSICTGFVKHYVFKKCTKTQFKEKIFRFVRYIDYDKDISDFWAKNISKIKNFYLKNQKEDDVIISASPLFVVEPACKTLGIKHIMCSKVDVKTGIYDGINCHGKEKVRRYREVFKDASVHEFYSDSRSDTPLAEISEKPFLVKGNKIKPWK